LIFNYYNSELASLITVYEIFVVSFIVTAVTGYDLLIGQIRIYRHRRNIKKLEKLIDDIHSENDKLLRKLDNKLRGNNEN
jgi:hypothetical protein